MKRGFYILAFTFLGFLLQFIVHALAEMAVLSLLLKDFGRYGLGLTWSQWYAVHHVVGLALLIAGIGLAWYGASLFKVAAACCVVVFITELIVI